MSKLRAALLILASTVMLTTAWGTAQQARPKLADYYTTILPKVVDSSYAPLYLFSVVNADLNADGNEDLVVLGASFPLNGNTSKVPQPGRVLLGDGDGHFTPAPIALFPVDTLATVHPRRVMFADFNGDGRPDMFISSQGWDASPFPGEQNRLYLSLPDGGWRDATDTLPQLSDFSHSSSVGDISGRGFVDVFVGNGYGGQNKIQSYTLLNTGGGQFTQTSTNIPVGQNQLLNNQSGNSNTHFNSSTLVDLDGDGLPELIVMATSQSPNNKIRYSTILWNRQGAFSETDTTILPLPGIFGGTHIDYDVRSIDVDQDGLPDLVLIGTQSQPAYDGWFVQILINKGNRQFVDETADRVPPGQSSGGVEGVSTSSPAGLWVQPIDFNHDDAPDFAIEFGGGKAFAPSQPLIWLNDGTGHFTTLKAGDFVASGLESLLGNGHLVATRNGYSFVTQQDYARSGGLLLTTLLAAKPYRGR